MTLPLPETPGQPPVSTAPRQLADDVLQSAEEAVLTDPVSVEGVELLDKPSTGADTPVVSRESRRSLGQYVADRPGQSALIAALFGAVAAGLLRQLWERRRANP